MRPRINQPQRVSQAEMDAFKGVPRPKRHRETINHYSHSPRRYTYIFGIKVYISEEEINNYQGFNIYIEK